MRLWKNEEKARQGEQDKRKGKEEKERIIKEQGQ